MKSSIASILIRYGTRFDYSHAGFYNDETCEFLSAQIEGGVKQRRTPDEKFTKIILLSAPGVDQAYNWALTQVGKPYDWKAILGIATNRDWHCGDDYFCSELVAFAFEQTGNPLINPDTVIWRITPRDLTLSLQVRKIYQEDTKCLPLIIPQ